MVDESPVRVRVVVHGRVQGVFFRDTVRRRARSLGVGGWVRNNPDGTVEAVFQGPAHLVDGVVALCHEGPPAARVEHVDVTPEPVDAGGDNRDADGFQIR